MGSVLPNPELLALPALVARISTATPVIARSAFQSAMSFSCSWNEKVPKQGWFQNKMPLFHANSVLGVEVGGQQPVSACLRRPRPNLRQLCRARQPAPQGSFGGLAPSCQLPRGDLLRCHCWSCHSVECHDGPPPELLILCGCGGTAPVQTHNNKQQVTQ